MYIRPLFNRIGSKFSLLGIILPCIPPHKIFVEPFVGSGVFFFNKPISEVNVISDADTELIGDYKLIPLASSDINLYNKKNKTSLIDINDIYQSINTSNESNLLRAIIRRNNRFNNRLMISKIYKSTNPFSKLDKIDLYQSKLSKAIIVNQSYQSVIREFDSEDNFFYLDPPYEEGNFKNVYDKCSVIDYFELRDMLRTIKGRFLMSLNFSRNIEEIFDEFNLSMVILNTRVGRSNRSQRYELLISN
jgi:DNA adenine methylase